MDNIDGILEYINKDRLYDYITQVSMKNPLLHSCLRLFNKYNQQNTSELPMESLFYLIMKEQDRKIKVLEEELIGLHNVHSIHYIGNKV